MRTEANKLFMVLHHWKPFKGGYNFLAKTTRFVWVLRYLKVFNNYKIYITPEISCRLNNISRNLKYLPNTPVLRFNQNVTFYCAGFYGTSSHSTCSGYNHLIPPPPICTGKYLKCIYLSMLILDFTIRHLIFFPICCPIPDATRLMYT